jgi:hypothetical protein
MLAQQLLQIDRGQSPSLRDISPQLRID